MQLITTIIILLGSHIDTLLKDRCNIVANYFYESDLQEKPHIYISGGIKHAVVSQSEVYLATNYITNSSSVLTNYIITDNEAQNTAENFRNFKCKFYDQLAFKEKQNLKIVIATSKFHHKRAKKLFVSYFPDYNGRESWLLGDKSCYYCGNDEKLHIQNVKKDVAKAPANCMLV